MIRHKKIYLRHFGYGEQDHIPCEICGVPANDIHHIQSRGMGGTSKDLDTIENLMALCRNHHNQCGASIKFNQYAKKIHLHFIKMRAHNESI